MFIILDSIIKGYSSLLIQFKGKIMDFDSIPMIFSSLLIQYQKDIHSFDSIQRGDHGF
jgi:hypothetical protein